MQSQYGSIAQQTKNPSMLHWDFPHDSLLTQRMHSRLYTASWKGTRVVVKAIDPRPEDEPNDEPVDIREMRNLARCQSDHVVDFLGVCMEKDAFDGSCVGCVVTPFYPSDMSQRIFEVLPHTCDSIAAQMVEAVAFVHAQGISHRDITPSNFLVNGDHIVLADFGLSRLRSSKPPWSVNVGTNQYRAPELLAATYRTRETLDPFALDLWALGCVIGELATKGVSLFDGSRGDINLLSDIIAKVGLVPWPEFQDDEDSLILSMFPQKPVQSFNLGQATPFVSMCVDSLVRLSGGARRPAHELLHA